MENEKVPPERDLTTFTIDVNKYKQSLLKSPKAEAVIYRLLLNSKEALSTAQIVSHTGFADPNGHIRNLRKNLIHISDYWVEENGRRYKRFFIRKDEAAQMDLFKRREVNGRLD